MDIVDPTSWSTRTDDSHESTSQIHRIVTEFENEIVNRVPRSIYHVTLQHWISDIQIFVEEVQPSDIDRDQIVMICMSLKLNIVLTDSLLKNIRRMSCNLILVCSTYSSISNFSTIVSVQTSSVNFRSPPYPAIRT